MFWALLMYLPIYYEMKVNMPKPELDPVQWKHTEQKSPDGWLWGHNWENGNEAPYSAPQGCVTLGRSVLLFCKISSLVNQKHFIWKTSVGLELGWILWPWLPGEVAQLSYSCLSGHSPPPPSHLLHSSFSLSKTEIRFAFKSLKKREFTH